MNYFSKFTILCAPVLDFTCKRLGVNTREQLKTFKIKNANKILVPHVYAHLKC